MRNLNNKAFSILEYTVLFVIIIGAFLIMRNYIQRGIYGNWGQSGQTFGFGRQYDPQKTIDCGFDDQANMWYDRNCLAAFYKMNCTSGDMNCQENIIINGTCSASSCVQLNNGEQP